MNPEVKETIENVAENPLVKSTDWNVVETEEPPKKLTLKMQIKKTEEKSQAVLDKSSFIMF